MHNLGYLNSLARIYGIDSTMLRIANILNGIAIGTFLGAIVAVTYGVGWWLKGYAIAQHAILVAVVALLVCLVAHTIMRSMLHLAASDVHSNVGRKAKGE